MQTSKDRETAHGTLQAAVTSTYHWVNTVREKTVTEFFKAKARKYYRCMTCASQPVREQSHFEQGRTRKNKEKCQGRRMTENEEAEWVAERVNAVRVKDQEARERELTED